MKRIPLDIKVYEEEWDPLTEIVQIPPGTDRQRTEYLLQVSETACETCRMIRQIIEEQPVNKDFSVDDIVKLYEERSASMYLSAYIQNCGHSPGAGKRGHIPPLPKPGEQFPLVFRKEHPDRRNQRKADPAI